MIDILWTPEKKKQVIEKVRAGKERACVAHHFFVSPFQSHVYPYCIKWAKMKTMIVKVIAYIKFHQ